MNLFQSANGAATFAILSALIAGMGRQFEGTEGSSLEYLMNHKEILYLGLFIVVFRIKTLFDDHKHFGETSQDRNVFRYIGFMLAVLSWIFWGVAAFLLPFTTRASEFMATSLLVSTLWVAVHMIEILIDRERRNNEVFTSLIREKWILVNIGYMLCLVAHIGWFRPVIMPGEPNALLVLLGLLFFDLVTSRSFHDLVKPNTA